MIQHCHVSQIEADLEVRRIDCHVHGSIGESSAANRLTSGQLVFLFYYNLCPSLQ